MDLKQPSEKSAVAGNNRCASPRSWNCLKKKGRVRVREHEIREQPPDMGESNHVGSILHRAAFVANDYRYLRVYRVP
jgi:hypothetical protein